MQETQETWVQSLGQEDPLKKEMATHFSILAREIQWTEEPGGLPWWLSGKECACNEGVVGDMGSIPGSGRSPGEGIGNPL